MAHFCMLHFNYYIYLLIKTKYTRRCSMKSSTIYIEQVILWLQFLCSKATKLWAIKFRRCENDVFFNKTPIRFFHISSLFYLIFCIKQKTKYTIRCSVKSSTIYIRQLILQLQLLRSKLTKFCATKFRHCKKIFFWYATIVFFPYLSPDMFYLKKQNTQKGAAWKALQFSENSFFYICTFRSQKTEFLSY
jgi:hypothetical protein